MFVVIPGPDGARHMIQADAIIGATEDLDSRGTVITLNAHASVIVVHTTLTVDELYDKIGNGFYGPASQINFN